jgi:hypothetical protein
MSEMNDMTCAELADVAAELALGVLTGRERAVAIRHLDTCDACREDVRQLMATGEQLRELLPPAEPPAGFEPRVLERLGLPAPAGQDGQDGQGGQDGGDAYPRRAPGAADGPRHRRAGRDTARPGTGQSGAPPAGPAGARRPGRMRRLLAAAAVGLAVIGAGVGGWRIGVGTAPTASPAANGLLTSASLLSATRQQVGQVFMYSGNPGWLYMSVELGSASGTVTCQVIAADGQVITIGSFRLTGGYGAWGSPNPGYLGKLTGARLTSPNGTVLATGTFAAA